MRHLLVLIIILGVLSFIGTYIYYRLLRWGFDFDKGTDR